MKATFTLTLTNGAVLVATGNFPNEYERGWVTFSPKLRPWIASPGCTLGEVKRQLIRAADALDGRLGVEYHEHPDRPARAGNPAAEM